MIKGIKYILALVILLFGGSLYADIKIYLYPNIKHDTSPVKVSDIGFVEGTSDVSMNVRESVIDRKYYSDSLVDRKELREILSVFTEEPIIIYGSAVRLLPADEEIKKPRELLVYRGGKVEITVKRKGITLEFNGIAETDAYEGDRLTIDMGKKGKLKGLVKSDGTVEVQI